ncbi:3-deoxy-D-manno-octulosonic acid transferase [Paludisphaera mucosa]|uniref:3-deoxy-D-manno-octulosonic acid transferase n=1 Tax=Paludisphaera mucosa TaxID=3030827 RepID=A0ABT6F8A1_9BACT|nr:3-deoxy-D-manno-octulosonic acid transferase [Paludisphaera mucosa]MDG3003822.1 3-deoxy-D-manno-octulosonic acid transferase [Paludisphaera mucosa]
MPLVLNVIYVATLILLSPFLVYRMVRSGKYRDGLWEKFSGDAPNRIGEGPCLWFHAVSVGEVLLLRPLVREMARRRPNWEVVISTTTPTGLAVARRTFPELITFYAPFDFSWATRRALGRIRPSVLALVELEVWPNLIRSAKKSGAKVAIINARLSERSHRGYRRLKGPLGPTLHRIDAVAAQDEDYARRFVDLGVPIDRVSVTGSVKFDGLESDRNNARTRELRAELGLSPADLVFVAGSTMEGEEAAALAAYRAARRDHPRLRLVLVPRHAERFEAVARWLEAEGEAVVRRSGGPTAAGGKPTPIILIDSLGELGAVWGLADVAFVGGSLLPGRGGQNMMEPAAYGASVMFGPHTANFRETVAQLLARNAARRVAGAGDLAVRLREDLDDPEVAAARGEAGRRFVLAQHGASGRTLLELDRLVESSHAQKSA